MDLLPPNPLSKQFAQVTKDADPLTIGKMQRLLGSIEIDLVAIHKGTFFR